jgi:hypothetical protein
LLLTLPHLPPAQVWAWVCGVQHPLPVHTWPVVQQTPLQHPGAGHPVCAPFVALAVSHWLLVHVATLHTGGVGQLVGAVHCTQAPLEQTPLPPPLSVQAVPLF